MTPGAEIEPGPHWWKASALTTRPTLPQPLLFSKNLGEDKDKKDRTNLYNLELHKYLHHGEEGGFHLPLLICKENLKVEPIHDIVIE